MFSRKMQYALISFVLFFLLTPGVLVTLPPRGCNIFEGGAYLPAALVHAAVFTAAAWAAMMALRTYFPSA